MVEGRRNKCYLIVHPCGNKCLNTDFGAEVHRGYYEVGAHVLKLLYLLHSIQKGTGTSM